MRIALVNLLQGHLSGVDGAIAGLARAADKAQLPLHTIAVAPESVAQLDGIEVRRYSRLWSSRAMRLFRFRAIRNAFARHEYDVVFLRYPCALDLDPLALFRSKPGRYLATVHHTKEVEQIGAGGTLGMRARAALEAVQGPRVLSRLDGIVGVTDEIARYELSRVRRALPSQVISNGIDVDMVPHSRFRAFAGQTLRVAFVASELAAWHGWDRLRAGLERYHGSVRVIVDAIGNIGRRAGTTEHLGSCEVRYHGTLARAALGPILTDANIAISSLAMHRIGLREGCVLKTREYTARGLPFVYAYDDVDLESTDPFCLRLPANESAVPMDEVLAFASRAATQPELADQAREVAVARMDWTIKARQFVAFAERLAAAPAPQRRDQN